jgi:hypothetical protein
VSDEPTVDRIRALAIDLIAGGEDAPGVEEVAA